MARLKKMMVSKTLLSGRNVLQINLINLKLTELLCLQLEKLPLSAEHALEMVSFC